MQGNRRIARRALRSAVGGIVVVALATSAAGPAAAQVVPGEWAASVCTGLADWSSGLANLSDSFKPPANAKPRNVRTLLVEFLGGAVDVSDTLVDDLRAAGYPDVENGKAVARVFTNGVTEARRVFAKAQRDARKLPTSSAARFKAEARRIERAINRGGDEVKGAFDAAERRYPVPALDRAFKDEPACQDLS